MPKLDKIEYEKRIRIVQEWIIEEWQSVDIIAQIVTKWELEERQAKRYIAAARLRWQEEEKEHIDALRNQKILKLKKLIRSLKETYKGTPSGIGAILRVEKEIIKLEGMDRPKKVEVGGIKGQPIETQQKITHDEIDYTKLSDDVLLAIVSARKNPMNNAAR